jgi:1-deoxy-D-xylulose 5-phosphate reductoisomerase
MVEFQDGAIIAQMGVPSMELPIQLALTYPERFNIENNTLNLVGKTLTFDSVDINRYPCFELANVAIKNGYNYPCALRAGDEEVVKLFLQGKIKYTEIPIYLDYVLQKTSKLPMTFENLEYTDEDYKYFMCVRFPNWNQGSINLEDIGYVTVKYVKGGIDKWYDGREFITYKYTNIIFLSFIQEKKKVTIDSIKVD